MFILLESPVQYMTVFGVLDTIRFDSNKPFLNSLNLSTMLSESPISDIIHILEDEYCTPFEYITPLSFIKHILFSGCIDSSLN